MRHRPTTPHKVLLPGSNYYQAVISVACGALLLAGCGAVPGGGPRPDSFRSARWEYVSTTDEAGTGNLPFVLVDVDRKVLESLSDANDKTRSEGAFTDRGSRADVFFGMGDTVRVTIFEAVAGGLFVPANATINHVTLPDQEVDQKGCITIPYAEKNGDGGCVKVHDRRAADIQNDIQQRIAGKAIEPQVIVSLVNRASSTYSVLGDVATSGRFNLTQDGTRILDALSAAGGPKGSDHNTLVTLQRGADSTTVRLSTLLAQTENNVYVQPNDIISVKKDDRYYNVLGAANSNNRVAFESENVSVADALAKAGGLNSEFAEPAAVVVFRRESQDALEAMGIALDAHEDKEPIPTVYRFDLTEPKGMFMAQEMHLRPSDVVYVSSHPFNDVSKLLGALRDILLIKLIKK